MAEQPWHELPPDVARVLRPVLPEVADEIIEAVRTVPAYARPLEGPFGEGIRAGVQEAIRHFLAEIEAGGPVPRSDVYVALGRGEMRAGRSLDALLSAYRLGARVAWRRFAAAGVAAGLAPDTLYLLAESIFAYIDSLSAESAEGHALEQSAVVGETQLRRQRLVKLLLRDPPEERATLELAAGDAGWRLPRWLAVVAVGGSHRHAVMPPACPQMRSPKPSASWCARSCPTPTVPAVARCLNALCGRRRGGGPRYDRPVDLGRRQLRARAGCAFAG